MGRGVRTEQTDARSLRRIAPGPHGAPTEVWQSVEAMMRKPHRKGTTMSREDYKALTLRLYAAIGEVFRTSDIGLLDPLLAPDMIDHTPA